MRIKQLCQSQTALVAIGAEIQEDFAGSFVCNLQVALVANQIEQRAHGVIRSGGRWDAAIIEDSDARANDVGTHPIGNDGLVDFALHRDDAVAVSEGSVIPWGVKITNTASTPGSDAATRTASAKRSGGASPNTSIGLPCDQAAGSDRLS